MKFLKLTSILFLLIAFSASKCSPNKNENMSIQLRIYNDSQNDIAEVLLKEVSLGNLEKGAYSEYVSFDYGYAYDKISFKIDGDLFELIPVDFVGEEKLKSGDYTYKISISDFENRLVNIDLVKD